MTKEARYFKIAKHCALVPMVMGLTVFALWLVTRFDILMFAGVLVILLGVLLSFVGMVALFLAKIHAVRNNKPYKRACLRHGLLLLINFPLALGIIACADYLLSRYVVNIVNHSPHNVEKLEFIDPAGNVDAIEKIPAGASIQTSHHFIGESSIEYNMVLDSAASSGMLIGYVSGGMGGSASMVIEADGKVSVTPQ
ncbi:MAG: hypothetical protein ACK502_03195 [Alphaproteobacteria bacterium]